MYRFGDFLTASSDYCTAYQVQVLRVYTSVYWGTRTFFGKKCSTHPENIDSDVEAMQIIFLTKLTRRPPIYDTRTYTILQVLCIYPMEPYGAQRSHGDNTATKLRSFLSGLSLRFTYKNGVIVIMTLAFLLYRGIETFRVRLHASPTK